jgi:hypothetical protein
MRGLEVYRNVPVSTAGIESSSTEKRDAMDDSRTRGDHAIIEVKYYY